MIAPTSLDTDLKQLLNEVNSGKIQLPEFQRSWTWDDNGIKKIISSLSQGYPMGAIMRLQYGSPEIRFMYRSLEGAHCDGVVPEYLILDGQQRLTSLYQALYSKESVKIKVSKDKTIERYYYLSIDKCMDKSADRDEAVISVPADRMIRENIGRDIKLDLSDREKEFRERMFPLNIVFDDIKLMDWIMECIKFYDNDNEAKNQIYEFKSDVLNSIISYKLPVITLDKSTPREAVCRVFENVNTGGVKLTVFELVTAMYATYKFDLRDDWEKQSRIIRGEGDTFRTDLLDDIDETAYLTAVTLYTSYMDKVNGKNESVSCKRKDVLELDYNAYKENRGRVVEGFKIAREFLLNYQFVFRKRDLPYTTQLIPLSAICAVLGKSKCSEPNTQKILSRWYWCGIFGEMYGGANETRYANDIEDVIDELNGRPNPGRTVNAAFFSATRLLTLQTRNSAAYKGVMALLYKHRCRDFMNDITIDIINSMTQSPDIHHIFPEKYCEENGIPRKKYNSIVNKTPILPETNRSIGGNAPSVYTKRILKKVKGLSEDELRSRVESHLINYDYLVADDFDDYFVDRAKKILDMIEEAMGKTISDRASDETVNQFGAAL